MNIEAPPVESAFTLITDFSNFQYSWVWSRINYTEFFIYINSVFFICWRFLLAYKCYKLYYWVNVKVHQNRPVFVVARNEHRCMCLSLLGWHFYLLFWTFLHIAYHEIEKVTESGALGITGVSCFAKTVWSVPVATSQRISDTSEATCLGFLRHATPVQARKVLINASG